ncbi:MAG: manganese efflux pump MntP family protein [Spirochaetaceae bacterium]|jgi:putative Mn2+ efflux pump MntP|nr:manganese efflux pump MntP family protein [Spirochaetaceae bacterium]
MGLPEIILIAIGLSMDAFAVSVTLGLSVEKPTLRETIIPGLYFGVFQALMPAMGYFAGINFVDKIQNLDHWIAFVLLGFIGGKMIKDSFSKDKESGKEKTSEYTFKFTKMIILAIATSIDALAVGITFAFFDIDIFKAVIIIGITTFIISTCGVKIGNIFGTKFKSKAECAGGIILVILGIKIVVDHIFFS